MEVERILSTTAYANIMAGVFGVQAVPTTYIGANGTIKTVSGSSQMESQIREVLNANLSLSPVANSRTSLQKEGSKVYINVKTKFFEETSSKYEMGVYLLESDLIDQQYVSGAGVDTKYSIRSRPSRNRIRNEGSNG